MRSSYLLAGIETGNFFRLLKTNRISLKPRYIFRFFFLLQNALWASFFAFLDRWRYSAGINATPFPNDPVFIIGHWRTGSTLLHQLLSLDDNNSTPSLFQTSQPNGFKSAYRYFRPIMKLALGKTRPFDEMKISMDVPQEDEFALLRLTCFSPMLGMVFPRKNSFFMKECDAFLPDTPDKLEDWKKQLMDFYRKLAWNSHKRLVIKNPYHSFRIRLLVKMFPNARFIHIYRNPMQVVPSTMHMWSVVGSQNNLNACWKNPGIDEVSAVLCKLLDQVDRDKMLIPSEAYAEIRYEDLEKDAAGTIRNAYEQIGLDFSTLFEKRLKNYFEGNRNYIKNSFVLSAADKKIILRHLRHHMISQQYLADETSKIFSFHREEATY